jgi:hypothetical protein
MLLEMLLYLTGTDGRAAGISSCPWVETAWFPADRTLLAMNNSDDPADSTIFCPAGKVPVRLQPMEMQFLSL